MINLERALQIVSKLLNEYLSHPDVTGTEEEEKAVLLIRDMAEGNGWSIQDEYFP